VYTLLNINPIGKLTRMIFVYSDNQKVYSAHYKGNVLSEGQDTWFKVQNFFLLKKSSSPNNKN